MNLFSLFYEKKKIGEEYPVLHFACTGLSKLDTYGVKKT
jgi:hypothetical protein